MKISEKWKLHERVDRPRKSVAYNSHRILEELNKLNLYNSFVGLCAKYYPEVVGFEHWFSIGGMIEKLAARAPRMTDSEADAVKAMLDECLFVNTKVSVISKYSIPQGS